MEAGCPDIDNRIDRCIRKKTSPVAHLKVTPVVHSCATSVETLCDFLRSGRDCYIALQKSPDGLKLGCLDISLIRSDRSTKIIDNETS